MRQTTPGSLSAPRRRIAAALLAFFCLTGVVVAGDAASAATESGAKLPGGFTFDPASANHSDQRTVTYDVVCPAVEGTTEPRKVLAIAPAGGETAPLSGRASLGDPSVSGPFPFVRRNALPENGSDGLATNFESEWVDGAGASFSSAEVAERLLDGGTYSLVLACAYYVYDADPDDYDLYLYPDAGGRVPASWTGITAGADRASFIIGDAVVAPTQTSVLLTATLGDEGVALQATVSADGSTATTARGQLSFLVNGSAVESVDAVDGVASLDYTAALTPGSTYQFAAQYVPARDAGFALSTSNTVALSIPAGDPTAGTSLVLAGTPAESGGVSLTATVRQNGAVATDAAGTVVFNRGNEKVSAAVPVSGGTASVTDNTAIEPGEYRYTADFVPAAGSPLATASATEVVVTIPAAGEGSGAGGGAGAAPGAGGGGSSSAANPSFSALTDWVAQTASTPAGLRGMFGIGLLLAVAGVAGWTVFWRRRGTAS